MGRGYPTNCQGRFELFGQVGLIEQSGRLGWEEIGEMDYMDVMDLMDSIEGSEFDL